MITNETELIIPDYDPANPKPYPGRHQTWLPELVAQSVLRDAYPCHLPSLARRCQHESASRQSEGTAQITTEWQDMITNGMAKNRAELAKRKGVSRACVTQLLGIRQPAD